MRLRALSFLVLATCGKNEEAPNALPITNADGVVPALRCPGSPGCTAMMGALTVGAAKRTITPLVETWDDLNSNGKWDRNEPFVDLDGDQKFDPVWMAGFSIGRPALGVHDDMWTRALTFTQGDFKMGWVSVDTVGYFHDDAVRIRQAAAAAGLDFDHIVVSSTHQHEGKDTMGIWGGSISESGYDPEYMAMITEKTVEALREAQSSEKEVSLVAARTDATDFVADSRDPQLKDGALTALRFEDRSGGTVATLTIWGNHPECLGGDNQQITSDYPHYLRETLEARYPGSTSVFVVGSLGGLMNPLGVRGCPDGNGEAGCRNGDFAKAEWMGTNVAQLAIGALEGADALRTELPAISADRHVYFAHTTNIAFVLAFAGGLLQRQLFDLNAKPLPKARVAQLTVDDAEAGRFRFQTEVNRLRIGPVQFLTVPGELYPELWLAKPDGSSYAERPQGGDFPDAPTETPLVNLLPQAPIQTIINQTNDSIGYIIPKAQFDLEPPRAYKEDGQYGEQNSVGFDAAPTLLENVRILLSAP